MNQNQHQHANNMSINSSNQQYQPNKILDQIKIMRQTLNLLSDQLDSIEEITKQQQQQQQPQLHQQQQQQQLQQQAFQHFVPNSCQQPGQIAQQNPSIPNQISNRSENNSQSSKKERETMKKEEKYQLDDARFLIKKVFKNLKNQKKIQIEEQNKKENKFNLQQLFQDLFGGISNLQNNGIQEKTSNIFYFINTFQEFSEEQDDDHQHIFEQANFLYIKDLKNETDYIAKIQPNLIKQIKELIALRKLRAKLFPQEDVEQMCQKHKVEDYCHQYMTYKKYIASFNIFTSMTRQIIIEIFNNSRQKDQRKQFLINFVVLAFNDPELLFD